MEPHRVVWPPPCSLPTLRSTCAVCISSDYFLFQSSQGEGTEGARPGPEELTNVGVQEPLGERFCNLTLGPMHRYSRPGCLPSSSWGASGWQQAEPMARAQPASMPAHRVASPGLHSSSGNEDVGDSRQV